MQGPLPPALVWHASQHSMACFAAQHGMCSTLPLGSAHPSASMHVLACLPQLACCRAAEHQAAELAPAVHAPPPPPPL